MIYTSGICAAGDRPLSVHSVTCLPASSHLGMSLSIWDVCSLDSEQEACIRALKDASRFQPAPDAPDVKQANNQTAVESSSVNDNAILQEIDPEIIFTKKNLISSEQACKQFITELDDLINILGKITSCHDDVTSRTNNLMRNCEDLLDRQV